MNQLDIWMLAIALAMDCFTVSIVSGVIVRRWLWSMILRIAFLFGLFQAMMPLIGWMATSHFSEQLEFIDHWIAFGLLAFIGGKMIRESFSPEEEQQFKEPSHPASIGCCHQYRCPCHRNILCLHGLQRVFSDSISIIRYRLGIVSVQSFRL